MSDLRKNLQVVQPNIELPPDNNGWPVPLTDPSSPLKLQVTNGRNGETTVGDKLQTSQQAANEHHLGETAGSSGNTPSSGALAGPLSTAETYNGDPHSNAENPVTRGDYSANPKTSQQIAGDHHLPEGE